ncbi:MAG: arsenite efflux transporter metallochaperone ArsD [Gemmatimonadaceae bacterium]
MARSLPLGPTDSAPAAPAADAPATLAGTVHVFDPAMCCPTGLCGPGVDPALLTISRDLRWLAKHGATVERSGLAQEPDAFVAQPRIAGLMQAFGDKALPAVLVNGEVLCYGRYPSRDELLAALTPAP